jgi:hypothetical protein
LSTDDYELLPEALPVLNNWVRAALVVIVLGLVAVFSVAVSLNPYEESGQARRMETHRQLGLPPCTFYAATGHPCPACGMTTSFALLVRGDLLGALRANSVGTLLGLFCLALIPWGVATVVRRQPLFVRSLEKSATVCVLVLLTLMFGRWLILLGVAWWNGASFRI